MTPRPEGTGRLCPSGGTGTPPLSARLPLRQARTGTHFDITPMLGRCTSAGRRHAGPHGLIRKKMIPRASLLLMECGNQVVHGSEAAGWSQAPHGSHQLWVMWQCDVITWDEETCCLKVVKFTLVCFCEGKAVNSSNPSFTLNHLVRTFTLCGQLCGVKAGFSFCSWI